VMELFGMKCVNNCHEVTVLRDRIKRSSARAADMADDYRIHREQYLCYMLECAKLNKAILRKNHRIAVLEERLGIYRDDEEFRVLGEVEE